MKLKNINWGMIAVLLCCLLFWVGFIAVVVSLAGCTQVLIIKPDGTKYQVNTIMQEIDFAKLRTPNLQLDNYSEEPGKGKLKVNPLLHNYEVEIGGGKGD